MRLLAIFPLAEVLRILEDLDLIEGLAILEALPLIEDFFIEEILLLRESLAFERGLALSVFLRAEDLCNLEAFNFLEGLAFLRVFLRAEDLSVLEAFILREGVAFLRVFRFAEDLISLEAFNFLEGLLNFLAFKEDLPNLEVLARVVVFFKVLALVEPLVILALEGLVIFLATLVREVLALVVEALALEATLAPFLRATDNPIAIACFLLFTLAPLPLLAVPFFNLCITFLTSFFAVLLRFIVVMSFPP